MFKTISSLVFFVSVSMNAFSSEKMTYVEAAKLYDNKKYEEAYIAFSASEMKGEPRASHMLGVMYDLGKGVKVDKVKALSHFMDAASQGLTAAQNEVGRFLLYGISGKKDLKEAYRLFKLSADNGNKVGAWHLGQFVFEAGPDYFTKNMLQKSLQYAKKAKSMGLESKFVDPMIGTLECALGTTQVKKSPLISESISHYELKGNVRVLEHATKWDNSDRAQVFYFGLGGHLIRADTRNVKIDKRYGYDRHCNLLRVETRTTLDQEPGHFRTLATEEYTISFGWKTSLRTQSASWTGESFKYSVYWQDKGGFVESMTQVGSKHPSEVFKKYNSSNNLVWSNGPTLKPSKFFMADVSSGTKRYHYTGKGTSEMKLFGGDKYLYSNSRTVNSVINSNTNDFKPRAWVDYTYGEDGWIRQELSYIADGDGPSENIIYSDYLLDKHGNWLSRSQNYKHDGKDVSVPYKRVVSYY